MRDEHDDRLHQALRHDLAANLSDIVRTIAHAFDRLHGRLYDAPWARSCADGARPRTKLTTL